MVKAPTAHDAALTALLSPNELSEHRKRVAALVARNNMIGVLAAAVEAAGITKKELAQRAGLDASAVRRMLTAETANPTTENAFRLFQAMDIGMEAVLPSGERLTLVDAARPANKRIRTSGSDKRGRLAPRPVAAVARQGSSHAERSGAKSIAKTAPAARVGAASAKRQAKTRSSKSVAAAD